MKCIKCGKSTKVLDSRIENNCVRRRRLCKICALRFTTYETPEPLNLKVIKRNEEIEIFNRQKILESIKKACNKRPITQEQIKNVTCQIENNILENYKDTITSRTIGKLVLDKLLKIDKVAYLRFASVYKNFQSIGKFSKEIDKIHKSNK